jgi:hypothetical protein
VPNKEDYSLNVDEDLFQQEDSPAHSAKNLLVNKDIFAQELMVTKDKFNG